MAKQNEKENNEMNTKYEIAGAALPPMCVMKMGNGNKSSPLRSLFYALIDRGLLAFFINEEYISRAACAPVKMKHIPWPENQSIKLLHENVKVCRLAISFRQSICRLLL